MSKKVTTVQEAIDSFLLSYKVEGKSYGTIEQYLLYSIGRTTKTFWMRIL